MFEIIKRSRFLILIVKTSICAFICSASAFSLIKLFSCDQTPRKDTVLIEIGNVPSYLAQILISAYILFVFFASIAVINYFYDRNNNEKIVKRNLKKYILPLAVTVLLSMIFFLFTAVLNLIFAKPIPIISSKSFFDIFLFGVFNTPAIMLIIATELFICNLFKNKKSRIYAQITLTTVLIFFSGGIFPISAFSEMFKKIHEYQPFGLSVSYITRTLTGYRPSRIMPEMVICTVLLFFLACLAQKILLKTKTVADNTALILFVCLTACIGLLGYTLMANDTAVTKIICVFDTDSAENEIITNTLNYYSDISCTQAKTLTGAKINLCYGNCDAVYVYKNNTNTEVYQRENTPLLNRAYTAVTEKAQNKGINLIFLTYYILLALSFVASLLIAQTPSDTVNKISIIRKHTNQAIDKK